MLREAWTVLESFRQACVSGMRFATKDPAGSG